MLWEIEVGIISGLITALLVLGISRWWTNTVYPWLEALKYCGVEVDGVWYSHIRDQVPDSDPPREYTSNTKLILKQSAYVLQGTATLNFQDSDNKFNLNFELNGHLWEGYLVLNFLPSDKRIMSYATAMLKISGGRNTSNW